MDQNQIIDYLYAIKEVEKLLEQQDLINELNSEFFNYLMFNLTHATLLFVKDESPVTDTYQEELAELLVLIEKYR